MAVDGGLIGGVFAWLKSMVGVPSLPPEYQECDGSAITDPLSPMVGQNTPDLNSTQRFLRGAATSGASGGADNHALSVGEMPRHLHTAGSVLHVHPAAGGSFWTSDTGGTAFSTSPFGVTPIREYTNTGGGSGTVVIGNAGGDGAHENRPAFHQVVFVMRIK